MPFGAFAPLPLRLGGSAEEGWAPEQHARLCTDLVSIRRVLPLARVLVTHAGTAAVTQYWGQNGAGLLYAPFIVTNGTGDVSLTFPAYWEDDYGSQYPIKLRQAIVMSSDTAARFPVYQITGQTIRVRTFDSTGAAVSSGFSLRVWS